MTKHEKVQVVYEYFILTIATLIQVAGIYVFKFPNNYSFGGVTGMSIVLAKGLPLTPGTITFVINMVLLILGFLFLGKCAVGGRNHFPNESATDNTAGAGTDLCDCSACIRLGNSV